MTRASHPSSDVLLGFAVGTGDPVSIPLRHLVVTGQSQEAGKTSTLEALIARAQLPAVAFITKRGEGAFAQARTIRPYFRERADWQFVASVLEATMRERLRFERAWIMRASKGARTLADVQANVRRLMATAKGLSADVYLTLDSYLEIVVPRVASVAWAEALDLAPGLNVLDLSDRETFPSELQGLVMRSVLEWVGERCHRTITIIPEAWEYIPEGRGSPVKLAAVDLIRKGAALGNYVWIDSQDTGGVSKELLRQCPVWILGVQREANEIKRTLSNIPASVGRPSAAEIATLGRGEFYACFGRHVVKTYVQPAWMDADEAQAIARGVVPRSGTYTPPRQPRAPRAEESPSMCQEHQKLQKDAETLSATIADLKATAAKRDRALVDSDRALEGATRRLQGFDNLARALAEILPAGSGGGPAAAIDEEAIVRKVLARIPAGGGAVIQVTPPEKLRADFQRQEVERIMVTISSLSPFPKRVLKLLEAVEGACLGQPTINARLGRSTKGGSLADLGKVANELAELGFVEVRPRVGVASCLRHKIAADLATYKPAEADIEATYQRVLYELATADAAAA